MEDVLQKIALTGATFVGKAAWSYAASLALKKISTSVQEQKSDSELQKELELLDQRLSRKLHIVTLVIDKVEILVAQGNSGFENVLELTDQLKQNLLQFSTKMVRNSIEMNVAQLKDLIMEIDDVIPLLQLVLTQQPQQRQESSSIAYSRLIQASSALVTGDSLVNLSSLENGTISIGPQFPVKMYTLFEASARKTSVDWTWKEEFSVANCSIERSISSRRYTLKIQERFDDGRYHDPLDDKRIRWIDIMDISKMFYTCSGKLLNIQESLMPVLVLKVVEKGTSQSDTPANKRPEWIALELYKGTADDSDTDSEAEITEELDHLHLESSSLPPTPIKPKRKEQQLLKEQEDYSLGHLCLLEYMLRLCALETRELKSHTQASDELLLHYLANTKRVQSFTAQPRNIESPGMVVKGGRLMDRFLNG